MLEHSLDHADSEYLSYVSTDRTGTEFIGNKFTYTLSHRHNCIKDTEEDVGSRDRVTTDEVL